MTLNELLASFHITAGKEAPRICADSRLVRKGDVFVAIAGTRDDGHNFIDQAIAKGAKYIVCQKEPHCKKAQIILVPDSAEALGLLAQAGCGNPCEKLTNLAVTGTNGKTTVTFLARSIIRTAGKKCGLTGTIINDTAEDKVPLEAAMTTPDALEIARTARQIVQAGSEYMVIEASSHALDQKRLAGIKFHAAAFTNLSGDHLDYHKTMDNYLAAKTRLFEQLAPEATAILNKQDPASEKIAKATKAGTLFYSVGSTADITARIESMDINGTVFSLKFQGRCERVQTSLIGKYNVTNHLAATGLCLAVGFDLKTIAAGLGALEAVPGRLEPVDYGQNFTVLIDYAHTDDALKNVLTTLRPLCKGNLSIIFGCGGDRDRTKRPRMAAAAEQSADRIIVTSDNPRTEKPDDIIKDIMAGFRRPPKNVRAEPDRKKAIELGIESACADDIILIAGKGHETYQIIGDERIPFSDAEVAGEILKNNETAVD